MLTLYTSNSMTRLAAALAAELAVPPASTAASMAAPNLEAVLTTEQVVTLGPAMARWVAMQLCRHAGIVANTDYPLPASTVWELARCLLHDLPDDDPFSRERLAWRIHALLATADNAIGFESLQMYLHGREEDGPAGLRRWQLAERIADVFDRYQLYRPELIRRWSAGEESDWQALLWRQLLATAATGPDGDNHRVATVDRLIARLKRADLVDISRLPERLSLFGVSTLPPLFVEVFEALARVIDVKLYLHSPTPHYWADLSTRKQVAHRRIQEPDVAQLWSVGNALLASWGRQGQAFQDLLLEAAPDHQQLDAFEPPGGDSLLGCIQRDIYHIDADDGIPSAEPRRLDGSLRIQVCHTAMRECQVLRDHLLGCLQADPALRPEEVLVLVPQITDYAPMIEAVFGHRAAATPNHAGDYRHGRSTPYIPWNLSDIAPVDEHPLVRLFLQLLALPDSRFSHSELLSYLDVEALAEHFRLDRQAVEWLREQFQSSGLCWGWDADHKAEFGLPRTPENTWKQTLDRLFAGYAFGDSQQGDEFDHDPQTGLYQGIAPIAVDGNEAEVLGQCRELLDRLWGFRRQLARPHSPRAWRDLLTELIGQLFEPRDQDQGKIQQILDAIADLEMLASAATGTANPIELGQQPGDEGAEQLLAPRLVRYWLTQRLADDSRGGRYFRGGVTFCGMKPMRGLPFKRIYLLGMQDQAYPRRLPGNEFDRMADSWRHGDPRPGDEDRYLFLEALLAAGEGLVISYTGISPKDNSERQPSVLVRELLDYIDARFLSVEASDGVTPRYSQALTTIHPLQPYSQRNYADREQAGFDRYWRHVGQTLARDGDDHRAVSDQDGSGWPRDPLPVAPQTQAALPERELPLEQLRQFLTHPPRYFVQQCLGIRLGDDDPPPEDDEPFALDGLQAYFIREDRLQGYLAGRDVESATGIAGLRARGRLPHSGLGDIAYRQATAENDTWLEPLRPFREAVPAPLLLDLEVPVDGAIVTLGGQLENRYRQPGSGPGRHEADLGLLHAYPSGFKGQHLLRFWLDQLVLIAQCGAQTAPARLYTRDQTLTLVTPPGQAQALTTLGALLGLYLDGLRRPLPLLPRASFAYAQPPMSRGKPASDPDQARLKAAVGAWATNTYGGAPNDQDDPYIQLLLRGIGGSPIQQPEFAELALAVYGPPLTAIAGGAV